MHTSGEELQVDKRRKQKCRLVAPSSWSIIRYAQLPIRFGRHQNIDARRVNLPENCHHAFFDVFLRWRFRVSHLNSNIDICHDTKTLFLILFDRVRVKLAWGEIVPEWIFAAISSHYMRETAPVAALNCFCKVSHGRSCTWNRTLVHSIFFLSFFLHDRAQNPLLSRSRKFARGVKVQPSLRTYVRSPHVAAAMQGKEYRWLFFAPCIGGL